MCVVQNHKPLIHHSFTLYCPLHVRTNHVMDTGCDLNGIKRGGAWGRRTYQAGGWTSGEVLFCQMDDKLINPLQCLQSRMTLVTAVGGDTIISATAESLSLLFSWPFYIVTANEVRAGNAGTEGAVSSCLLLNLLLTWSGLRISENDVFWLWGNSGLVFHAGSKPLW